MPYIGKSPSVGLRTRYNYTATAGQTSFSGADNSNVTLTYTDTNYTDVYLNGVMLKAVTDYASTTGTSIVLVSGAAVDDILEVVVYDAFSVADTVSAVDGGAFASNVSFGADISSSTLGTSNFRAGVNAGNSIASGGNYNVVVGDEAGTAITTGDRNTFLGYLSGTANTTGIFNTFVGSHTGTAHTVGYNNVAIGTGAFASDVSSRACVAIGSGSLATMNNTNTDAYNTAVGFDSGAAVTTGVKNTLIGGLAADSLTTGKNNVAVGYQALETEDTGDRSVAIGSFALKTQNNDADNYNTAVGYAAGLSVTTGVQNTLVGGLAGDALTTGQQNTVLGYGALSADTTGITTVAIGRAALEAQNFTGGESSYNTAVGYHSGLSLTTGTANTFIGALTGDGGAITGTSNTACGYAALTSLTTNGGSNTGLGKSAGSVITTGDNNIGIGDGALNSGRPGGAITTGSNVIGLGNADHTEAHIQIDWTVASDARDKTDFTALDLGLDFVKALAPVTYKWDKRSKYGDNSADDYDLNAQSPDGTHKEDWLDIGFKAQEVQVLEEAAGYKAADKKNLTVSTSGDGKQMGLQYSKFVPILVKAIQELSAENKALADRLAALEGA